MILGGEQPVALPTMSWYDKDAFKMYIAAVKDDYDKNIEEQKDFLDKYIDIAATDKDREYMANNVINPVVQFVQNNPEAIRSVQGRAMLRQLRNAIDPEKIARIKGTAKIADPYNKVKAQMIADGTYSEDMQKAMGAYLNDWDSANNGAFQQAAPYKLDNIQKLLSPTIDSLAKNAYKYNDALTKEKKDGKRYSTISDQQIYDALNYDYLDLMQRPSMQYHMKKFLETHPNLTEEAFKKELFNQVRGQLGEKTEKDDLYFNDLQFRQSVALENLRDQHARQLQQEKTSGSNGGNNGYPHLSSRYADDSNEQFNKTSDPGENVNYFVNYFSALARTEKNPKKKSIYQRYANEWSNYNNLSDQKKSDFLKKYGYLDGGVLTKKYYKYLADVTKTGGSSQGYIRGKKGNLMTLTSGDTTAKNAWNFHKRDASVVPAEEVESAAETVLGQKQKNGYYKFTFGGNGRMTVPTAMDAQGVRRHKRNIYDLTENWLRQNRVSGNVYSTDNVYQRSGNNQIQFNNVGVTVKASTLIGLCNYLRKMGLTGGDRDLLIKAGIKMVDARGETKIVNRTLVDKRGNTTNSKTETSTDGLYGLIPATFYVSGRESVTKLNQKDFNKSNPRNSSYGEFANSFDSAEDVK